jgi:hypothetical protein
MRHPAPAAVAGQATVEIVGLLGLLVAIVMVVFTVLAGGAAMVAAEQSAEAGALALMQERDPRQAARRALPRWARSRVRITVRGRTVTVVVRGRTPFGPATDRLAARAEHSAYASSPAQPGALPPLP